jgi:hypothetical protein
MIAVSAREPIYPRATQFKRSDPMFYIAVMERRDLDGAEATYRCAADSSDEKPARLAREALSDIED